MTELRLLLAGLAGSPSFSDEGEGSSFTEGVSVSPEVGVVLLGTPSLEYR
jgi:hypothetical protein